MHPADDYFSGKNPVFRFWGADNFSPQRGEILAGNLEGEYRLCMSPFFQVVIGGKMVFSWPRLTKTAVFSLDFSLKVNKHRRRENSVCEILSPLMRD